MQTDQILQVRFFHPDSFDIVTEIGSDFTTILPAPTQNGPSTPAAPQGGSPSSTPTVAPPPAAPAGKKCKKKKKGKKAAAAKKCKKKKRK